MAEHLSGASIDPVARMTISTIQRLYSILRDENDGVLVLVPGGREIDWPKLRAHLGVGRLSLPDQEEAREATGYEHGAIMPFGATSHGR